jgi:regulator of ribonuclease activity A
MFQAPSYLAMPDTQWSTSDLCDEHLDDPAWGVRILTAPLRRFGGRSWYFGLVLTARAQQGQALSLANILQQPGQGRVLLVQGSAGDSHAVLGDRMAGLAVQNGWAGIILDGFVRDSVALRRMPLGVHTLGTRPNRASDMAPGETGQHFEWAGVGVSNGDWVYADEDGIILMRRRHVPSQ